MEHDIKINGRKKARWVAIVADMLAAGLLGAVVAWGFFDAGRTIWVSISALLFALIVLGIRLYGRFDREFILVRNVLIGGFLLVSLTQLFALGIIPTANNDYTRSFDRLWTVMNRNYPYFELKGVNWDLIRQEYAPKIAEIDDSSSFFQQLREILAKLNDPHTTVVSPNPSQGLRWLGVAREIEGQVVVTKLRSTVDIPGLQPGAVILAREGTPINDYLESFEVNSATDHYRRYIATNSVLAIPEDKQVEVTYLTTDGQRKSATLQWKDEYNSPATDQEPPLITGKQLSSGIGVITIPTFAGDRGMLISQFDAALDSLWEAPGLILDIRGNPGGSTFASDPIAGRFVSDPFVYGTEFFRQRLPLVGWTRKLRYQVKPRGEIYTKPVVVLTDTANISTAENFIVAMIDSKRAVAIGRETAGASGNPITLRLADGEVRVSMGSFRRNDGRLIEGVGITPDYLVEWKVDDVVSNRDPDIQVAEEYLLSP